MNSINHTITDNKNNSFLCDKCNKILASKFSLDRHKTVCKKIDENINFVHPNLINVHSNLINVHSNLINVNLPSTKQYNCDKCNKKYNTIKNFEDHIKNCKGLSILTCPKCMITFSSRFSKSNHIKRNNCKARSIIYANTPQTNIINNNK